MKKVILAAIFLMLSISIYAATEKDFKVDGIMRNPRSPGDSSAILNGKIVKKGDLCEGHTVKEVGPDYVVLEPAAAAARMSTP